MFINTHKEM